MAVGGAGRARRRRPATRRRGRRRGPSVAARRRGQAARGRRSAVGGLPAAPPIRQSATRHACAEALGRSRSIARRRATATIHAAGSWSDAVARPVVTQRARSVPAPPPGDGRARRASAISAATARAGSARRSGGSACGRRRRTRSRVALVGRGPSPGGLGDVAGVVRTAERAAAAPSPRRARTVEHGDAAELLAWSSRTADGDVAPVEPCAIAGSTRPLRLARQRPARGVAEPVADPMRAAVVDCGLEQLPHDAESERALELGPSRRERLQPDSPRASRAPTDATTPSGAHVQGADARCELDSV